MRTMCKWKKDEIRDQLPQLAKELLGSRYVCKKCARLAPSKDWLCKPTALAKLLPEFNAEAFTSLTAPHEPNKMTTIETSSH